jgi:hypothetical protein
LKIKECVAQGEPVHPAVPLIGGDPVGDIVGRAKKFGSSLTKGIRSLASTTPERKQGDSPSKRGIRALGRNRKKNVTSPKADPGQVRIGDEINMLEAPWVDCQGVYSCKAIRRSAFVEEAMSLVAHASNPANQGGDTQTVCSSDAGDGAIPEDLSEFMQTQAGGLKKVCWELLFNLQL